MSRHPHAPNCLFCKIARGEIPSATVLETDDAVAFLDISPVNRGHVLLVPKSHHATLIDLPEPLACAHTATLLPRLCRAIQAATGADGFNVIVNNGRAAGQTIDHGHWHIIPRFHDDSVDWPWPHGEYVGDELGQMRFAIERELDPSATTTEQVYPDDTSLVNSVWLDTPNSAWAASDAMKSVPQWKTMSLAMVEDFERHLATSAPKHAKLRLEEFRHRLAQARN